MIIRIKKKDDPYVRLDKRFINDPALSLKAKGIMTYLLSKPDGWHVRVGDLVKQNKDMEKSVRSGIKELISRGYMCPNITRDPETKSILKYDYDCREIPIKPKDLLSQKGKVGNGKDLLSQNLQVGNLQVGNRQLNNKGLLLRNESNKGNKKNSNSSIKGIFKKQKTKNTATVSIKHKRKFNKIKPIILSFGWRGSLDEIINFHNIDPEYVRGWVEQISQINIDNPAGLLRQSLRAGEYAPKIDKEESRRKKYLDDPLSEFIEKESV